MRCDRASSHHRRRPGRLSQAPGWRAGAMRSSRWNMTRARPRTAAGPDQASAFHHAHAFRGQVAQALEQELPEALRRWRADGAEVVRMPLPDGTEVPMGVRSRRVTFERALRSAALGQPGFAVRRGGVDGVTRRHGRRQASCDGSEFAANLVIDASGRAGRSTRSLRPPATSGGPCGIAYVDRHISCTRAPTLARWRTRSRGRLTCPAIRSSSSSTNAESSLSCSFAPRRTGTCANSATRQPSPPPARPFPACPSGQIPPVPSRSPPCSPAARCSTPTVQTGHDGRLALPGLVFLGDAVATTTPTFGRGLTTTLLQARHLLKLIDEHGAYAAAVGESSTPGAPADQAMGRRPRSHG